MAMRAESNVAVHGTVLLISVVLDTANSFNKVGYWYVH